MAAIVIRKVGCAFTYGYFPGIYDCARYGMCFAFLPRI